MKLLEKSKEKHSIEDETISHQIEQLPCSPYDKQDNFMMGNQRRGKLFE